MNKKPVHSRHKIFRSGVISAIFGLVWFSSIGAAFFLQDAQVEIALNSIVNYRKVGEPPNQNAPFLRFSGFSSENVFLKLYEEFEYNSLTPCFRTRLSETVDIPTTNFHPSVFALENMNVGQKSSQGYHIQGSLFCSLFPSDFFANEPMTQPRYGADSFIYLSRPFADRLLNEYSLSSYEELLVHPVFSVISLRIADVDMSFSINNIIEKNVKTDSRLRSLYGDFYCVSPLLSIDDMVIEIDLGTDVFGNKLIVQKIEKMGLEDVTNSLFLFSDVTGSYVDRGDIFLIIPKSGYVWSADMVFLGFILTEAAIFVTLVLITKEKLLSSISMAISLCGCLIISVSSLFVFIPSMVGAVAVVPFILGLPLCIWGKKRGGS